ncbi:MAG: hypothetical protein IMW92_10395 [Bacillales bacterium]|nr:hypothetical protein [Bacillales bacterium]
MIKKPFLILSLLMMFTSIFSPFALAAGAGGDSGVKWDTAYGNAKEEAFSDAAKKVAETIINIVRSIAIIIAVVMVVILAVKLFSGGVQAAAEAKTSIVLLILALFIAFNAETIVGVIVNALKG